MKKPASHSQSFKDLQRQELQSGFISSEFLSAPAKTLSLIGREVFASAALVTSLSAPALIDFQHLPQYFNEAKEVVCSIDSGGDRALSDAEKETIQKYYAMHEEELSSSPRTPNR